MRVPMMNSKSFLSLYVSLGRLLCLLLVTACGAHGATVTGRLVDIIGTPSSPIITIVPLSTPLGSGSNVVLDVTRTVKPTNGVFTTTLMGGYYEARFGSGGSVIRFTCPADTNSYQFTNLMNLATFTYPNIIGSISSRVLKGTNVNLTTNNAGAYNETITVSASVEGGIGSVTSVGLSLPSPFQVTVTPVTSSGVLTAALLPQSSNSFFAGPVSGSAATPAFRGIVDADVPMVAVASNALRILSLTNGANNLIVSNQVTSLSNSYGILIGTNAQNAVIISNHVAGKIANTNGFGTNLSLYGTTTIHGSAVHNGAAEFNGATFTGGFSITDGIEDSGSWTFSTVLNNSLVASRQVVVPEPSLTNHAPTVRWVTNAIAAKHDSISSASTEVIFNNSGTLGGSGNLTFTDTSRRLDIGNLTNIGVPSIRLSSDRTNGAIGTVSYQAKDTTGASTSYGTFIQGIVDGTDGSEDGYFSFSVRTNGQIIERFYIGPTNSYFNTPVSAAPATTSSELVTYGQTTNLIATLGGGGGGGSSSITNQNMLYVSKSGNDSTGTRHRLDKPFLTIGAAKANAVAGDTIWVLPGIYDETDLAKDGVTIYLAGADIDYTGPSETPIFTDAAGAWNFTLDGFGSVTNRDAGEAGREVFIVKMTNSASRIHFKCNTVSAYGFTGGSSVFELLDGEGDFAFDAFVGGNNTQLRVFNWIAGEWRANVNLFREDSAEGSLVEVWCPSTAGVTGNFYLTSHDANGLAEILYGGETPSITNANQRNWITVLNGTAEAAHSISVMSGRNYLTAQKLKGAIGIIAGELWTTIQKLSSSQAHSLIGGTSENLVQELEDIGTLQIISSGGSHIFSGDKFTTTNAVYPAVSHTGGGLTLKNYRIQSGTNAIDVTSSGLVLQNISIAADSSSKSISATNAQTVNIIGTLTVNTAPSTNVVFTGGQLIVTAGTGNPEGFYNAPYGSKFYNGSTLYVKETYDGKTGWDAK